MTDPRLSRDAEAQLRRVRPASVSPALMARLRGARPSRERSSALPRPVIAAPASIAWRRFRLAAWSTAAALAVVGMGVWVQTTPRWNELTVAPSPALISHAPLESARAPTIAPASPTGASTVFLPVEVTRQVLRMDPVTTVHHPDEAPRHFVRAVVMENVTAVGADTDAALLWRRAREVFLPVHSPVY